MQLKKERILQCSETEICLMRGKRKDISFRNKSNECLIRVNVECIRVGRQEKNRKRY